MSYRSDIDGLRAIAVVAVILFHLGYLPNGYLGVDVFFVISGYLITKIVFTEATEGRFSITQFYLRRIRRIIPLVLFTASVALIAGILVMLPNDLKSLSESVVATNFFANNILLFITTRNYWDVVNEYKPLMHTWSLGIEEQFYLLYPLIFLIFKGARIRWIPPLLFFITITSLFFFITSQDEASKFYLLHFRFFELSIGGLGAIIFKRRIIGGNLKGAITSALLILLSTNLYLPNTMKLFMVVMASLGIVIATGTRTRFGSFILENKSVVGIGKISFSLYMWHQIILAFTRYFVTAESGIVNSAFILILILLLSILTYFFIEKPFRDKQRIKMKMLLSATSIAFVLSTCFSLYVYSKSGVLKDLPELEIVKADAQRGMFDQYNSRIYALDKEFADDDKIKVLVIGNSFARDWANILLESKNGNQIQISYISDMNNCKYLGKRFGEAKYVYFSAYNRNRLNPIIKQYGLDLSKVWCVGTKNFGANNGLFYNKRRDPDYFRQKTKIGRVWIEQNNYQKKQWGDKYIDLIGMIVDTNGMVPVFTPDCKYISQDCMHLTHAGAVYFGQLLGEQGLRIE